jgi:transcriptional regulator with XRE-family HTH domain
VGSACLSWYWQHLDQGSAEREDGSVTAANTHRRVELAQFLRSRRARLTPQDVGLPPGLRRRTPGLRREEVAQLAGVGVTWYTWLEQGRNINASVSVLDAIARTLHLDPAEREHLYLLADVPMVPELPSTTLAPEVQEILDALAPLPAVVYSGRYDALAWNATYHALFPGLTGAPVAERNALWQMFTVPACCSAIGNRETELSTMVATFRAAFGRHIGEPAWVSFVDRLRSASPEFAEMWARHDVASPATRVKVFARNLIGADEVRTTATSLAIASTPEARIVVYTPIDETDRAALEEFTRNPPQIQLCPYHERQWAERRGADRAATNRAAGEVISAG